MVAGVFAATTIKKTTRNYDNFHRTLIMSIIKVLKIVSEQNSLYIFPLTMLPLFLCLFTINNMVHVEYRREYWRRQKNMKHDKNTNFNNLQYSNIFSSRVYFAYNKTSSLQYGNFLCISHLMFTVTKYKKEEKKLCKRKTKKSKLEK